MESFSGKRDNALGRFDPGRRGLVGGRGDGHSVNTIGIRIALEEQVTSVDIILMKIPTASILFHLFGAHSRIFVVSACR